jgi:alkylation response protein AidB-like acyl-CoA dehydrogenase
MFPLNDEQQLLVRKADRFAEDHARFLAAGGSRLKKAKDIYKAYAKAGYHALLIPKEFKGQGLDYVSAGLVYEALSSRLPGTINGPVTTAHCAEMMKIGLVGERLSRHLSSIAGKGLAAGFCLTEEGAGSDIASITTSAKRHKGGFVISGKKSIVINHALASYLIVFATSSPAKGRAGLNAFLVDPRLPGLTIGDAYDPYESSGSVMGEVVFDGVVVPEESLLGEEGSGYFLLMETLDKGRPIVAACCVGSARRVFDMVLAHVKSRSQFGKPLFSFQGISFPLAEHATRLQASRLLAFDALSRIDTGRTFSLEASMAKLHASETLLGLASFGMEALGYRAAFESHEIRRIHHDAQLMMSIDGTANVQKMVIASQL